MLKRLAKCVREFKKPTVLTLIFIIGEAVIECIIPFVTTQMVNRIQAGAGISEILKIGGVLILLAVLSLCCGGLAGFTCAKASSGFAKNLRTDLFEKVQTYSFANIDKFSSSSLVTRLTTDVTNVQMAFMMIIRIAIRAPPHVHILDNHGLHNGRCACNVVCGHHSDTCRRSVSYQPQGNAGVQKRVQKIRPPERVDRGKRPRNARRQGLCA